MIDDLSTTFLICHYENLKNHCYKANFSSKTINIFTLRSTHCLEVALSPYLYLTDVKEKSWKTILQTSLAKLPEGFTTGQFNETPPAYSPSDYTVQFLTYNQA